MGNCLKIQSSSSWSTDDDDGGDKEFENGLTMMSRQPVCSGSAAGRRTEKMDEEGDGGGINEKRAMHGEIKIRMTKKQLEELVSVVGMEGLSIEEFLEKVTSLGIGENHLEQRRHWQPVLQSIPEEA